MRPRAREDRPPVGSVIVSIGVKRACSALISPGANFDQTLFTRVRRACMYGTRWFRVARRKLLAAFRTECLFLPSGWDKFARVPPEIKGDFFRTEYESTSWFPLKRTTSKSDNGYSTAGKVKRDNCGNPSALNPPRKCTPRSIVAFFCHQVNGEASPSLGGIRFGARQNYSGLRAAGGNPFGFKEFPFYFQLARI